MNWKKLPLITLIVLFPVTAYTGIYKWTDAEGKVHYSQTRPEAGIESENMRIKDSKMLKDSDQATANDDQKDKAKEPEQETAEQPQEITRDHIKLEPKAARKACETAKSRLAKIQATGRVRQKDAQGNITYLSDAQKQEAMKKEQRVIKLYCK